MNLDKVFNLFDDNKQDYTLVDFKESSLFQLLMFKKIIINHFYNRKAVIALLKQTEGIDEKEILDIGDNLAFDKAYEFLQKLNIDQNSTIQAIKEQANEELLAVFLKALIFYEKTENYEKCAFIKPFFDKIKEFLN